MGSRVDQRAVRWFVHLESVEQYYMAKWVLMAEVKWRTGTGLKLGLTPLEEGSRCTVLYVG